MSVVRQKRKLSPSLWSFHGRPSPTANLSVAEHDFVAAGGIAVMSHSTLIVFSAADKTGSLLASTGFFTRDLVSSGSALASASCKLDMGLTLPAVLQPAFGRPFPIFVLNVLVSFLIPVLFCLSNNCLLSVALFGNSSSFLYLFRFVSCSFRLIYSHFSFFSFLEEIQN